MNKSLYLKAKELNNESNELFNLINLIKKFLDNNETKFKNKESIIALKVIKNYLLNKEKELEIVQTNCRNNRIELVNTCNHEIAIKNTNIDEYFCLICNHYFGSDIPEKSLISIDTKNDYKTYYEVKKIFDNLVNSDRNIIEDLTEELIRIQYEKDIKVYRR